MADKNLTIKSPLEDLEKEIIDSEDFDSLKNAVDLFNINLKKKEILRTKLISDLQGKALDQMSERLEKKAGEFSNKDLLDYYKTLKDTTPIQSNLDSIPQIQINQQNINVGDSPTALPRESRERIANVVEAILNKYTNNNNEVITQEVEDETDGL